MFSGSKFQRCGPVIEKEFLANEAHLNFGNLRRSVLFDLKDVLRLRMTYLGQFLL